MSCIVLSCVRSGRKQVVDHTKGSHQLQRIAYAPSPVRETHMAADSNSNIAWHRAQVRKHREALKHFETAKFTFGQIAGSKTIEQTQKAVAELKRKIRDSEQVIAAYERQTRRPLTTDQKTLANVPWSKWNGRGSSNLR